MSATAIDAVVAAAVAALRVAPAVAGGRVWEEGDIDEIPADAASALIVGLDNAAPGQIVLSGAPLQWSTVLRIECFVRRNVRGADGALPTTALHAQAHARLVADPTLGGVASGVDLLRVAVDRELAATRTGVLVAFYAITHRSTHDSLLPA